MVLHTEADKTVPFSSFCVVYKMCGFIKFGFLKDLSAFKTLRNCTFSENSLGKETYVKFILHLWCGKVNVLTCVHIAAAVKLLK